MHNKKLVYDIISKKTDVKFTLKESKILKLKYKIEDIDLYLRNMSTKLKIYTINKKYLEQEYNYDEYETIDCGTCKMPKDMYIFRKIYDSDFRKIIFDELETTFNNNKNDSSFSYQDNGDRIFMFDDMNFFQVLKHSHKLNPILSKYLYKIIVDVFSNLQIKKKYILPTLKNSKLVISRYINKKGIYTHIDNVGRSDGIVLTITFGPKKTYYDLIPLDNKKDSLRIIINEGEPVIMDGTSRYVYAHAIPNNIDYYPTHIRYSLIFLLTKYNNINCKNENKFYNIEICSQNNYDIYI